MVITLIRLPTLTYMFSNSKFLWTWVHVNGYFSYSQNALQRIFIKKIIQSKRSSEKTGTSGCRIHYGYVTFRSPGHTPSKYKVLFSSIFWYARYFVSHLRTHLTNILTDHLLKITFPGRDPPKNRYFLAKTQIRKHRNAFSQCRKEIRRSSKEVKKFANYVDNI